MYGSMIGNANAFTNRQHSCKIAFVDDTGPADVHDGILAWSMQLQLLLLLFGVSVQMRRMIIQDRYGGVH